MPFPPSPALEALLHSLGATLAQLEGTPPPPAQQSLLAAPFTTYKVGGPLQWAYQPQGVLGLLAVCHTHLGAATPGTPFHTLGWGSNTLVASAGVAGHTLLLRKVDDWLPLAKGPEGEHRFFGGAGVHLAKIAKATVDAELEGGEFLIGIPGTLGGAVCMNAGAMGQETSGMIETVWVWDRPSGQVQQLTPAELAFAYRYSAINPQRQVVLGAVCHFSPSANPAALRQRMEANRQFRKEHHPIEPNGGSVFRNPEGVGLNGEALPAVGRMVEALGAKGLWQEGEAGISERHGNFIVNRGQATSTQVLKLMRRVQQAIESAYGGLRVYPENRWMGEATPEELALWQALTAGDPHRHPTA